MINHTPHTLGQAGRKHGRSRPRWFPSLCGAAALGLLWTGATAAAPDSLVATVQTSHYNGYQVSCFGMKDGWITVNATGGVPPYAYRWSNGAATATITDLAAGYYRVAVIDQDGQMATVEATLEQPLPMKLDVDVYEYANGYNTSCYNCSNGNASVVVVGGAAPFTINWSDGPTGALRYNLGPKGYKIAVTDANNCAAAGAAIYLRGPARNDWSMTGNAGIQPGPHFIGTTDNKDLVLKSNGLERLRLKANGEIAMADTSVGIGVLRRDPDGILRAGGFAEYPELPPDKCRLLVSFPYWETRGNYFDQLCPEEQPILGTMTNLPLPIYTNGVERMRISTNGKVGIGTTQPAEQFEVHHADERGGITLVNTLADNAHSEVRFTAADGQRWGLGCDFHGNGGQDFFLWDEQATAKRLEVNSQGKVGIGTVPPLNGSIYKLYVADGIATRDVKVTAGNWPDFVFADGYRLMPLSELRAFLERHSHLPGIPSAAEVERNEGVELGDMQVRLLKVVEEQYLYILQLEEQQEQMEHRIKALEERNN